MNARVRFTIAATTVLVVMGAARADFIVEVGDAGDMPKTSQFSYSDAALEGVIGTISDLADADLYAIWISDPKNFSATTDVKDTVIFDTQLFLFTEAGLGVYANDDVLNSGAGYNPRSLLPAGDKFSPTAPGLYFIAVSGWDRDPHSAKGAIFEDDTVYNAPVGPVAPGGAEQITGWDGDGNLNGALGGYTLLLTGAQFLPLVNVPEPGSLILIVLGLVFMVAPLRIGRAPHGMGM